MPKLVDHADWRRNVVAAAADLIAEQGLPGMTFRALATRLGCSTTVISHYFRSRNDLLESVYDATNADAARIRRVSHVGEARTPVQGLEDILPVAPRQQRIWRIWLSFWNSALFDDALRDRHRRGIAGTRGEVRDHFLASGFMPDDAALAAEDVMQAIFGIAMQAVFDRDYWHPDRQLTAYRRAITGIVAARSPDLLHAAAA